MFFKYQFVNSIDLFQICMTLFLCEIIGFNLYCGLNTFLTIAVMSDIDSFQLVYLPDIPP